MSGKPLILFSSFLCLWSVWSSLAAADGLLLSPGDGQAREFYKDHKRGWYWYEKDKVPRKREEKKEEKAKQHRIPSLKDYAAEALWNMHPDDFQPLLLDFQKKAVMNPSEENVREYYVIQDIARRKSLAFANSASFIMQKYPELNVATDYPTATPGRGALTRLQADEIRAKLVSARSDFGLIYFYSPSCQYCVEQGRIVDMFRDRHGWEVKKVNRDDNPQLAEMFNVKMVPYILLVYRYGKDAIPVSAGVIALSEMEEKIYRGVRLVSKEITPEEYSTYDFQRGGPFDVRAPLRNDTQESKGGPR
ncbi:MAG TPA: conjugal transfer protein TraF [Deltaproteobacteria bacterium]|nr:conjugal transfer protein TraF [Deltaproteobacteria bacterium]